MADPSTDELAWLPKKLVLTLHAETLHRFGGTEGLRDEGCLESALDRPRNQYAYGDPSVFDLAAAYCHGVIRNPPFVDGNKRTGLLAARAFLSRNGYHFGPDEADMVQVAERVAAGEVGEDELTNWIEQNAAPR